MNNRLAYHANLTRLDDLRRDAASRRLAAAASHRGRRLSALRRRISWASDACTGARGMSSLHNTID